MQLTSAYEKTFLPYKRATAIRKHRDCILPLRPVASCHGQEGEVNPLQSEQRPCNPIPLEDHEQDYRDYDAARYHRQRFGNEYVP